MNTDVALKAIFEKITTQTSQIVTAIKEIENQEDCDSQLLSLITDIKKDLNRHESILKENLKGNQDEYNAIVFFKKALSLEYKSIYDYQLYADSVEDAHLKKMLIKFGAMELLHAKLLSDKIIQLGGMCEFQINHTAPTKKLTVQEMLQEHKRGEKKAIALFENGLKHITDPELNWFIGRLKMDETDHLQEIEKLLSECTCLSKIVHISGKVKWHDDYVEDDQERPWIDG